MTTSLPLPDAQAAGQLLRRIAARAPVVAPRPVDKSLVLYGAGNMGKMAKAYFERLDIPVSLVVDRHADRHREDPTWQDTPICTPDAVRADQKAESLLAVCIATSPYGEVHAELSDQGWHDIVPFYDITEAYRHRHPLGNGWFTGPMDARELEAIEDVLTQWHDDVSRAHHLQFIAWHALRDEWRFDGAPVTIDDRYFIPEVHDVLHEHEVFVDVGAHRGEVSLRFVERMRHHDGKLWLIEADTENLRHCEDAVRNIRGRQLLHCAVGEHEGEATFFPGLGYASQLCPLGTDRVPVRCIDRLSIESPSFIKMHLEGSELAALRGAADTIRKFRPIIAVTAYHNRHGLWELPNWFFNQLHAYRILSRLHGWCGTGFVIYAIPEERISI